MPALQSGAERLAIQTHLSVFRTRQAERDEHAERCARHPKDRHRCLVLWWLDEQLARDWHELTAAGAWLQDLYQL